MVNKLKLRYLRILAHIHNKKVESSINLLSEEQKSVYNIAMKLLASPNSKLEEDWDTGSIYCKNGMKLLTIDSASIQFIDGKFTYYFGFDVNLIKELRSVFIRQKRIYIKQFIGEVKKETQNRLSEIYQELIHKI